MSEPAKYLFDRCFEQPAAAVEDEAEVLERRLREGFERDLAAARTAAHAEGVEEGKRAAMDSLEARSAEAIEALAAEAQAMSENMDAAITELRARAVETAVAVAEALASELIARYPTDGIEAMLIECLDYAAKAPHLAVRVAEGQAEKTEDRLRAAARARGFAGDIVVLGDPEMAPGDARIEWADGGVAREFDVTRQRIREIVQRFVAAQGVRPAGTPETGGQE